MQRYLNQAKKEGYITKLRHLTILVAGTANVGKTCLLEVLQGNVPPTNHSPTPARKSKKLMITTNKVDIKSDNTWAPVDIESQKKLIRQCLFEKSLRKKATKYSTKQSIDISKSEHSNTNARESNKASNVPYENDAPMNTVNDPSRYSKAVTEPDPQVHTMYPPGTKDNNDSTNLKLTINVISGDNKTSFDDKFLYYDPSDTFSGTWDILSIIDTAGQPEMINLLPVINKLAKITFIVFNMLSKLDDPVKYYDDDEDNNHIKTYYSNLNVIECILSMISYSANCIDKLNEDDRNSNDDKDKFQVCLVGTHYDKVIHDIKLLQHINETIARVVEETKINEICNVWNRNGSEVYKIDASQNYSKYEQKEGDDTKNQIIACSTDVINKIRADVKEILEKSTKDVTVDIPLTWLLLELLIVDECTKSNRFYMKREKVTDLIQKQDMKMNVMETNSALKFLHKAGVLLYFLPEENKNLSNFVFSDPNWLFGQLTTLINITNTGSRQNSKYVQEFTKLGKLHLSLVIEEFKEERDVDLLLLLLEHMKIIALMHQEDENPENKIYFMPCVLPPCKLDEDITAKNNKAAPLHIKFKFGVIPRGVFCCLVVTLLERNGLFTKLVDKRYNNLIRFQTTVEDSTVELRDRVSSIEIIVEYNIDRKDLIYCHVQHLVTCSLTAVWKNFELSAQKDLNSKIESSDFIQFGFGCDHCKKSVARFCQFDFKCEDCECNRNLVLRNEHKVWFVYNVRTN